MGEVPGQKQDPTRKLFLEPCPHCRVKKHLTMEWTDGVRGARVYCSKCGRMTQRFEEAEVECQR